MNDTLLFLSVFIPGASFALLLYRLARMGERRWT
jgi:hypothetical protein